MKRSMKNFSEDKFCSDLHSKLNKINDLIPTENINVLFQQFLNCISEVINSHCPLTKRSKKAQKLTLKPWITKGILKAYRTKKKLYLKQLKTKSPTDKSKYKKYSNILTKVKDTSKSKHYQNLFTKSAHDIKKTWKNINDVIKYKKPTTNQIDSLRDENNVIIQDKKEICNIMNDYFVNIGNSLGNTLSSNTNNTNNYVPPNPIYDSFFLKPVTEHEVLMLIENLDLNKSTGPNHTQHKFIKIGKNVIAPV